MNEDTIQAPRITLLTEWNKHFEYPTQGTLRRLVFDANKNGFNMVIRRIRSRILISVPDFFRWVDISNGITDNK